MIYNRSEIWPKLSEKSVEASENVWPKALKPRPFKFLP